jgi:hypothetical protein
VPEGVVDLLEVIQIDEQQGHSAAVHVPVGQGPLELVDEPSPVAQSGQLVGDGLVPSRFVRTLQLAQGQGHAGPRHHERGSGEG